MSVVVQPIKNTVEIAEVGEAPVEVRQVKNVVDISAPGPQGAPGPAGPPGPPNTTIGGYAVDMSGVASGDTILFGNQNAWINAPEQDLTDGGNF